MPSSKPIYDLPSAAPSYIVKEEQIEYSRRVEMAEVEIDLDETHQDLVEIEKAIAAAKEKHNAFLRELGLKPLP